MQTDDEIFEKMMNKKKDISDDELFNKMKSKNNSNNSDEEVKKLKKTGLDYYKILGVDKTDSIKELALNFREDIAILHNGILESICFCFPSS